MTITEHSNQLAILLLADTSEERFIDKIRPYRGDLAQAFAKPVIGLSEGVLLLSGFYPGPWLDHIPWNTKLTAALKDQWEIFEQAKDAIRCWFLNVARQEVCQKRNGTVYYVRLPDLCRWMLKKNINWIAPECYDHVIALLGGVPKKRGQPLGGPDILAQLADYFHKKKIRKLTIELLRSSEHQDIHPQINSYLAINGSKYKITEFESTRRLKTLRANLNKILKTKTS